ncbi:MAG: DUF362 domain-containing protein [Elusimicrobia bacterium]|nr:DUF362 domain-containing protein [Elusimicrobiota bacterium]
MTGNKVVFTPCKSYQKEDIQPATVKLLQELGNLDKIIKPGQKVLLKVNLLMKKPAEAGVTTHPALVETIVNQVQSLGAKVIIADSPGGPFTKGWLKGIYRETWMEDVAKKTGAQLNWNFQQEDFSYPEGKILKQITLAHDIKEADVIISLAKLKTHGFTIYTGAVKNLFGTIPGLLKADYHLRMSDIRDFSNMLVDVAEFVKPQISIIDAVIAMEGSGPSAGDLKQVGLLGASTNPHALDLACCHLIGLSPKRVFTLQKAIERKLVVENFEDLDIKGMLSADLKPIPFKVPASSRSRHLPIPLPEVLDKFFYNILRPKPDFIHEKCIGCGLCARNCPAKCIQMIETKPYVDLTQCIRCFCCQELCPERAVEIKRGKLSRILFR